MLSTHPLKIETDQILKRFKEISRIPSLLSKNFLFGIADPVSAHLEPAHFGVVESSFPTDANSQPIPLVELTVPN